MKIYQYWHTETVTTTIGAETFTLKGYGGSNSSEADARLRALEKIEYVKRKIAGHPPSSETYEAEIREEVVQRIDDTAIITRNRYGAQVLNVEKVLIMDIDHPPPPKLSLGSFFRQPEALTDKEKIVASVRQLAQTKPYQGYCFRIYETHKGVRVIVLGQSFDPQAPETQAMMKAFNSDQLYRLLCKKQACFRARLTPKPSRMKLKSYKVQFPRAAQAEQEFRAWLKEYEAASRGFSVCKLVEQIGIGALPPAVRVHDELSGVNYPYRLA